MNPEPTVAARSSRRRSIVGFTLGILLLAAAIWAVARSGPAVDAVLASVRSASPLLLTAIVLIPIANWLVTSLMFWVLTRRYGQVGIGEMAGLIGSAWLLNNLPLRPGLVGRVAYHKAVNGIRVRDSVKVMLLAGLCAVIGVGALLLVAFIAGRGSGWWPGAAWAASPLLVMLAAAGAIQRSASGGELRPILIATSLRYIDVLLWTARYSVLFAVLGRPIDPVGAAVLAAASQAVMFLPVQLGVREWIVGLASGLLPPELLERTGETAGMVQAAGPGLLVDLVNRAAELLVAVPVGIACTVWLWRTRGAVPARASLTPES